MGRTKRRRSRKKNDYSPISLECDPFIIVLKQWMNRNNWKNENCLRLFDFQDTGRGLAAPKNILKLDALIEVPYELMITHTTLAHSFLNRAILPNKRLKMLDILSVYLVFERHKGQLSKWKTYIDSLPKVVPPVSWLCSPPEMKSIPEELKFAVQKRLAAFESSWELSKGSIDPRWKCECCKIPGDRVLTLNSFTWAYVMVNTRAVYVDPDIVRGLSRHSTNDLNLSDDPCMALCPYLDMFNHSNKAATNATLEKVDGKWMFKLTTMTTFKKYNEVFISYGSHDNVKLLCEYGFFIPDDELDTVTLDFNELLKACKISVNEKQYKFIRGRNLYGDLYVTIDGLSFNLKAVLFVVFNSGVSDWCPFVFSDNYPKECLLSMYPIVVEMIRSKREKWSNELENLKEGHRNATNSFKTILSYLHYKVALMQRVVNRIKELIN